VDCVHHQPSLRDRPFLAQGANDGAAPRRLWLARSQGGLRQEDFIAPLAAQQASEHRCDSSEQ